ncbi:MAG: arginyl-tRNA--protein-N-Asp/Glu arginylyltransferase [Candidatus Azotimanducaceae bacterium]|jgi:arginyl-tRNA--protein-N-Asp/Glu arginylyltransferase
MTKDEDKVAALSHLKFFTTPGHDCSYLDGKIATTLFVDPGYKISTLEYSELSALGFRRSGQHIYRPHCQDCKACIPLRIPVGNFKPNRTQKRIFKKNHQITVHSTKPEFTLESFDLYDRYIRERHSDGDMYPPNQEQYTSFLIEGRPEATFFEFRLGKKLIAIAVADQLKDGLSAIYTFFDPELHHLSLGSYAILWLLNTTIERRLTYLYMGYWIKECQKMSYKTDYKPMELFINNQWLPIDEQKSK